MRGPAVGSGCLQGNYAPGNGHGSLSGTCCTRSTGHTWNSLGWDSCCVVPCCRLGRGATSASSFTWFGNPEFWVMSLGPPYPVVTTSPTPRRRSNLSHCAAPVGMQGWQGGLIPPGAVWELAPGVCGYAVLGKMEGSVKVGAWRCWRTPSPPPRGQGQGQQVRGLVRSAESGMVCFAVHRAWSQLHVPAESAESCSVGRGTPVMSPHSPPSCNPKSAGTAENHCAPWRDHGDTLGTLFPSLSVQLSRILAPEPALSWGL